MGESIALFCKGYISAYSNAGCYHILEHRKSWRFGFWLGVKLRKQEGGQ